MRWLSDMSERFSKSHIKLLIWSLSAGTIVAFFYVTNSLSSYTSFNPGGSVFLISPIMCGLILGIVTADQEAANAVIGTILMMITSTVLVALTLLSPFILGVVIDPTGAIVFVDLTKEIMLTIITVLPLSMLGSVFGRMFAENTIMASTFKVERQALRSDTDEWYKMLDEKLEEKRAALEKLEEERRKRDLLNVEEPSEFLEEK
jgi:hypothetical protein